MTYLIKPIITEKSMFNATRGVFTFMIDRDADKSQVKSIVEATFGVHVVGIHTITRKGGSKRVGRLRKTVMTLPHKIAMVELKKGEKIELFDLKEK